MSTISGCCCAQAPHKIRKTWRPRVNQLPNRYRKTDHLQTVPRPRIISKSEKILSVGFWSARMLNNPVHIICLRIVITASIYRCVNIIILYRDKTTSRVPFQPDENRCNLGLVVFTLES